jgi:hypothetical protein
MPSNLADREEKWGQDALQYGVPHPRTIPVQKYNPKLFLSHFGNSTRPAQQKAPF